MKSGDAVKFYDEKKGFWVRGVIVKESATCQHDAAISTGSGIIQLVPKAVVEKL